MTASLQPDLKSSSRRALLAGALGGIGAWAASAIGRASPVKAEGQAIVVGGEYPDATSVTKISNLTNGNPVLQANSTSGHAVEGFSTQSLGVYGSSTLGTGVYGDSDSGRGVTGVSDSSIGVFANSVTNTGLYGASGSGSLPAAKAKTGVYGYATQDNFSRGVTGESPAGIGVYGISTTGYGGYFGGKVYTTQFYELSEIAAPAAPLANRARLFLKDNGAGKTQLCVRFNTGAVQVIATQP